jgi:hypothetical protein
MTVYLYAICSADAPAPPWLAERGLRYVERSGLAAVVGDEPGDLTAPSEEDLWAHEKVVESLMDAHDLLPARFGGLLSSDEEVCSLLDERSAELRRALDNVSGAVELAVRAGWRAEPDRRGDARATGSEYMADYASRDARARALAECLDDAVSALARDGSVRVLPRRLSAVTGAYLVDTRSVEDFRRRIERLNDELPDAEIVCTGPWPPYSFAGDGSR